MCHVSYPGFFPIGHIGGPSSPFDGLAGNPRHRQRRWPRREFRTHVETTPVTPVFALLAGIVLLGAQALGMLTAHRHLSRQLAQQSESGARTLPGSWAARLSTPHEREVLADELYSQAVRTYQDCRRGIRRQRGSRPGRHHGRHHGRQLRRLARTLVPRAPAVSLPMPAPTAPRAARSPSRATPRWRTIRFGRAASAPWDWR